MWSDQGEDLFIWQHFLHDQSEPVILLPSPHGVYKNGISYSDACAMGEIYAKLQKVKNFDVRHPELLGDSISKNLILIGGQKVNSITKAFQSSKEAGLNFYLEDGVIYDEDKEALVTPEYSKGKKRSLDNLTVDYGLIIYTDNPFGQPAKVLHLAGIKGFGTLAAAIAVTDKMYIRMIQKLIKEYIKVGSASQLQNKTVEVLVKVCASNGRLRRDSLCVEKIRVSDGRARCKCESWESEEYKKLKKVLPYRLYIDLNNADNGASSVIRVNDKEVKFSRSPDRLKLVYILAEQAKEDYLNESERQGWLNALELAQRLWQIKQRNSVIEMASELRREISNLIITWARHLQKRGKLTLGEDIDLDHEYINSEILVLNFDIKKKIADLVYLINQDQRNKFGSEFQLIETQLGLGYRISIHPALIFIPETNLGG